MNFCHLHSKLCRSWRFLTGRTVRRRYWLSLLGFLWVIHLTAACGQQATQPPRASTADCQTIEHDVGQTEICGQPQRIAVMAPHMLDILLSLDVQPVGYAEFSSQGVGEPLSHIPVLGERVTSQPMYLGLRNTPSLEALLQLKPELIIGESFQRQYYERFSQIAPTLLYSSNRKDEWQHSLRGVAQALERSTQAEQVIEIYQQKLAATRIALAPIVATKPNLLLMGAFKLPQAFSANERQDFLGGLFEDLGFQLVLPSDEKSVDDWLSMEILPQMPADIIFALISTHLREDAVSHIQQVWQQNPITRSLPSTQTDQVYFLDAYLFYNIRGPITAQLIMDKARALLAPDERTS